jgi:hypothetical protein
MSNVEPREVQNSDTETARPKGRAAELADRLGAFVRIKRPVPDAPEVAVIEHTASAESRLAVEGTHDREPRIARTAPANEADLFWSFYQRRPEEVPYVESDLESLGLLDPTAGPSPSEIRIKRFVRRAIEDGLATKRRPLSWREFIGALPFGAAPRLKK